LVPRIVAAEGIDVVIANAENVCGGSGLTPRQYRQVRAAGVDLVTMGDHIYRRSEILSVLAEDDRICKPANFPESAPGRNFVFAPARNGVTVAAFTLLGRTFMRPVDCPFHAADHVLAEISDRAKVIIVDMHAEATADKYLMAHHLKGRVSAVLGTHTHVPTADEQILGTTAFISDVGMTGPHDSILGRRVDRVLSHMLDFVPTAFDVATGDVRASGVIVDVDEASGHARSIRRIQERLAS
jgi:metallophosphoesterase (TIGR00282 family)